jgi:hypothetical protein
VALIERDMGESKCQLFFACVTGAASNLESEAQDREPMQKGEEEKGQAMDEGYGMEGMKEAEGHGVLNGEGMQMNDEGERDLGWGGFRGNRPPHPIEGALMPQSQHVKASCANGPACRARMVGPCTRRRCGGVGDRVSRGFSAFSAACACRDGTHGGRGGGQLPAAECSALGLWTCQTWRP